MFVKTIKNQLKWGGSIKFAFGVQKSQIRDI